MVGRPVVARISYPAYLNRGRFAGKKEYTVPGRMSCEIDKDIDPIVSYQFSYFFIGHAHYVAELDCSPRKRFVTRSESNIRIAEQLKLFTVMCNQNRFNKICHRMPPEIRRYITDTQFVGRRRFLA